MSEKSETMKWIEGIRGEAPPMNNTDTDQPDPRYFVKGAGGTARKGWFVKDRTHGLAICHCTTEPGAKLICNALNTPPVNVELIEAANELRELSRGYAGYNQTHPAAPRLCPELLRIADCLSVLGGGEQ